jgi:hypothetical protein
MAKPYSLDLRERVADAVLSGRIMPGSGNDLWCKCGECGEVGTASARFGQRRGQADGRQASLCSGR